MILQTSLLCLLFSRSSQKNSEAAVMHVPPPQQLMPSPWQKLQLRWEAPLGDDPKFPKLEAESKTN